MRSRSANARMTQMSQSNRSSLFAQTPDEEKQIPMRRRQVKKTQMGSPILRARDDVKQRKPMIIWLEWTKAILICVTVVSCFLTFAWYRRSLHLQRKASNFGKLDRCNLNTYPLWKIQELKDLNLSGCELVNLPNNAELWRRFTSLKKLDLNNNTLTELPNEMSALSSLEILFLSENKFETIPSAIGKLTNLRVLSLRGNVVQELSSSHLPTASIIWLILTNNKISKIDTNIGDVKLLRKLMLSHNMLDSVPVELGECKDLELIRLADNNISDIPAEVLTLPKLAWISLSGNPMSKSPSNIKKLIKESDLDIMKTKVLGKGASGVVYQARYNDEDVAVKMFKQQIKGSDGNAADEAGINGLIDHPLAMSAIGVIPSDEGEFKGMVMELVKGTQPLGLVPSFSTVTRDEGPAPQSANLSKEQVLSSIYNIALALDYIHSSVGASHSDVYAHNILRDDQFTARLSDWGASFIYEKDTELAAIFERIEVLAFGRYVQDMFDWHLNIDVPDSTKPAASYFRSINKRKMDDGELKDLIASILQPDQASRPTFRTIKAKLSSMTEFEAAKVSAEKLKVSQFN